MRKLIGAVAGIAAMIAIIALIEALAHAAYPTPAEAGADMRAHRRERCRSAQAARRCGWFVGAVVGSAVAARVSRWRRRRGSSPGLRSSSGVATVS